MKVAVSGASGFVGTYVLRALAQRGDVEVVAIARRPLAPDIPAAVQRVDLDIASATSTDYEKLGRPDVLIHLAWSGLPNYKSPHHFEEQLGQQYRFLKYLVRAGLPSMLCAGTCLEYGMRAGQLSEDLLPDPQLPYAYAKDALRRELVFLRDTAPFGFTWARLFYMYGAGQPATTLYSQLCSAVQRGERSFRMSRGEQLRDYLPVAEVARYLVRLALDAPTDGIVNVCSGHPVSVRSLVEGWLRAQCWEMELELGHFPYPDYEPLAFWGDPARLRMLVPV
jgi:nucleoside-diphosphate-sugar epimerase